MPVRVSAISFLNPAPLLYDFEHPPAADRLRSRYRLHYTSPALCAAELHAGEADLGLIPIAELTPDLAIVPGCTIASLHEVRSILLLVRQQPGQTETDALRGIRSIAADQASRSSAAYLRVLLDRFYGVRPPLTQHPADAPSMLQAHDAALLIGDPALLAREQRLAIEQQALNPGEQLLWIDIAALWRRHTGLPWVAAVWAVRPEALPNAGVTPAELIDDLTASRDAGITHTDQLVHEWLPRLALPEAVIRTYLTQNIHYTLDDPCLQALQHFRALAAEAAVLPTLPKLHVLQP